MDERVRGAEVGHAGCAWDGVLVDEHRQKQAAHANLLDALVHRPQRRDDVAGFHDECAGVVFLRYERGNLCSGYVRDDAVIRGTRLPGLKRDEHVPTGAHGDGMASRCPVHLKYSLCSISRSR